MAEYLDVLDENGVPTGRVHLRGTPVRPGDYMGAVVVCVINSEGLMLIQHRVATKASWPGKWDVTAGGAMSAGESPQEAAMREVYEEMGIRIDLKGVRPSLVTLFSNGFSYIFVVKMDVEPDKLVLQEEEVQAARFADFEEIMEMVRKDEFVPYRKSWMEYVFEFAEKEFLF